jgi:hypothetical protein
MSSARKSGPPAHSCAENAESVPCTIAEIMGDLWFLHGYGDALARRPFPNLAAHPADGWAYERGRLFGVYVLAEAPGMALHPVFTPSGHPSAWALEICTAGFFGNPPALV